MYAGRTIVTSGRSAPVARSPDARAFTPRRSSSRPPSKASVHRGAVRIALTSCDRPHPSPPHCSARVPSGGPSVPRGRRSGADYPAARDGDPCPAVRDRRRRACRVRAALRRRRLPQFLLLRERGGVARRGTRVRGGLHLELRRRRRGPPGAWGPAHPVERALDAARRTRPSAVPVAHGCDAGRCRAAVLDRLGADGIAHLVRRSGSRPRLVAVGGCRPPRRPAGRVGPVPRTTRQLLDLHAVGHARAVAVRARPPRDRRAYAAGGLVVGLAFLARTDGFLLGLPFAVAAAADLSAASAQRASALRRSSSAFSGSPSSRLHGCCASSTSSGRSRRPQRTVGSCGSPSTASSTASAPRRHSSRS